MFNRLNASLWACLLAVWDGLLALVRTLRR